ncbi:MAG: prolipoprotein diacylglyceryl transferase [Firmicutes bacterium]|nr:prolipoprotein diacylglyceryl transferase [Bacillota bacterium]
MINTVNFPGLGIYLTLNRVAFTVGIREIYWYGIIIGAGLLTAVLVATSQSKKMGLPKDTIADITLIATPFAIIFARLYFVLWNFKDYIGDMKNIFNIRQGGLAIYGGIIGGVAAAYVYCRIKKVDVKKVFDSGAFGLLIGQAIGRFGNFVNVEAYGSQTALPWRMEIYSDELGALISVHPTFLYESLWNVAGLIMLLMYRGKKKFEGELFLLYVAWYGIGRAWVEQLRVDSLPYGASFKVSQIFAIVTAVAAVFGIIYNRYKIKQKTPLK